MRRLRLSLFMLAVLCSPPAFAWTVHRDEYVVQKSPHDFETTVRRGLGALEAIPQIEVETTDKAAQAREAFGRVRPTVVVTYMRPDWRAGLLSLAPLIALHVPFRFVIRETLLGQVYVFYEPAVALRRRYNVGDLEPVTQILSRVQRETMEAVLEE